MIVASTGGEATRSLVLATSDGRERSCITISDPEASPEYTATRVHLTRSETTERQKVDVSFLQHPRALGQIAKWVTLGRDWCAQSGVAP